MFGPPSDRKQQVRSDDLRLCTIVDDIDRNAVAVPCHANDLRVDANVDAFAAENVGDHQGDVFVLTRDQDAALVL